MSRLRLVGLLIPLAVVAACTPPPTVPVVPPEYPPCVGTPTCIVAQGGNIRGAAISDDGRIMATMRLRTIEPGVRYESTIGLVGIDDRWYREVVRLDGGHLVPWAWVMTPDAESLVYPRRTLPGDPIDPTDGLQVYRRSTRTTTRVAGTEIGDWSPYGISDDGRVLLALENTFPGTLYGVWKFDLVAGTSERLGIGHTPAALSGDGRYAVLNRGSQGIRIDLTDGSEVVLPSFVQRPSVSGDGSRIADAGGDDDIVPGLRYLDVGDTAWTALSGARSSGARLARDGSRLVGVVAIGSPVPIDAVVDVEVDTGSTAVIAPASSSAAVSPNADHVLYQPLGGTTILRWSR